MKTIFETITAAVREAADTIKTGTAAIVEIKGEGGNYVTEDDLKSRDAIVRRIKAEHPETMLYTEESKDQEVNKDTWRTFPSLAVVDEFDGTTNHASGIPLSAIMIGHYAHGEPTSAALFDRNTGILYSCVETDGQWEMFADGKRISRREIPSLDHAMIGVNWGYADAPRRNIPLLAVLMGHIASVRIFGCGGIDMMFLATGVLHGYIAAGFSPFDLGAGLIFLKAAGIRVETYEGQPATIWDSDFIAAAPELFPEFKRLLFG